MLLSGRQENYSITLKSQKTPRFFTRLARSRAFKGYLFISPWLLGFLVFGLWPLLTTFYNSFTKYDILGYQEWVGLKNYQNIFTADPRFAQVSLNMAIYVSASTVISICGGLWLALLLNRKFPGNHLFRTIIYVPSLLVGIAIGMLFKQVFAPGSNGLANAALAVFHLGPIRWLGDSNPPVVALVALILVNLWFTGSTMLIFLAGLKGISSVYYEAAKIDGAGRWKIFWHITLPLLSPVLVFNTITTLIAHIQVFETPYAFASSVGSTSSMNNPLGYHYNLATFLTYIYELAFKENGKFGYASALAVIVFIITLLLTLLVLAMARYTYYGDQSKGA
ncbi:sugar ABC transporter permease [Ktedonosporobacter rubrisoli]|uniref:Sugar ABC transporter permease n=1 Tax=Ktedonosporobacter rubrisoli TaxID=2509675 RepID=A0A4P6JS53_KTERU|nr:sugar ABC transporter permease [Ktedonosporobacter rubrisoli]QBD78348.1 sugar ABC transporter permease [Ktedonosporobacter rubrisoli]